MQKIILLFFFIFQFAMDAFSQQSYVDSLQTIIALDKHDDNEMKAYYLLAANCFRNNPEKAKSYLGSCLILAVPGNNFDRQCAAYSMFLSLYQNIGNMDSALYYVNKLKAVAANAPGNNRVMVNYNQALGLYYKKSGDFNNALPYSLAAAKYSELTTTNKADIGGQWLNTANVYTELGEYNKAMECNLKALRLFEEAGNKLGESFCYNGIAIGYLKLRQFPRALEYAEKSLALKKELKDKRGICSSLSAMGEAYAGIGNIQQAVTSYDEALKISKDGKIPKLEADIYFNMAKVFVEEHKDSTATAYFNKCKELALQLDNKQLAAYADNEIAVLYKKESDRKQTEKVLITSLSTFKEAGTLDKEADNYKKLSDFYANTQQYDKALENINKFNSVKDSLTGLNVQVQLRNLEEQYNSEKKIKEISLLKKDNELQQQKFQKQRLLMIGAAVLALLAICSIWLLMNRNKLKQRMKELELRNQIAADLHDEVGSSLSSIHLLSQMAAQPGNEATHKDILTRMSTNAKETMDKMGDIVWMIKPSETEAGSLKQRMERFAYEICSSKNIEVNVQLEDLEKVKLSMEQRKNIYLIFKEAVNNAVKYSGTEKIEITSTIQNKQLTLQVKDFGKGFDSSIVKKGNGLDNMQHRAKELGGELLIETIINTGTTMQLIV
ncbi:MAG: tetratricopeptide repeat protein [Ferruginibacter sp.]